MTVFKVRVNLRIPDGGPITREELQHLSRAVKRVADRGQDIWKAYALGAALPDGRQIRARSGNYMKSIQRRELGDFREEIYSNSPYARSIEEGMGARDLKKMLDTSSRTRVSKTGKRYLIIPFRWDTPGATRENRPMGREVHDIMRQKAFAASHDIGRTTRPSGLGAYDIHTRKMMVVPQNIYKWGDRLKEKHLDEANVFGVPRRRMLGMVKMQNPTGRGGGKHSQYLTFRVMSEDSPGWKTRAVSGYYPARTTAEQLRPLAKQEFEEAARQDIRRHLGLGG